MTTEMCGCGQPLFKGANRCVALSDERRTHDSGGARNGAGASMLERRRVGFRKQSRPYFSLCPPPLAGRVFLLTMRPLNVVVEAGVKRTTCFLRSNDIGCKAHTIHVVSKSRS